MVQRLEDVKYSARFRKDYRFVYEVDAIIGEYETEFGKPDKLIVHHNIFEEMVRSGLVDLRHRHSERMFYLLGSEIRILRSEEVNQSIWRESEKRTREERKDESDESKESSEKKDGLHYLTICQEGILRKFLNVKSYEVTSLKKKENPKP